MNDQKPIMNNNPNQEYLDKLPDTFVPWNKKTKIILGVLLAIPVILIILFLTLYFSGRYKVAPVIPDNSPKAQLEEVLRLVGKIAVLPQNDEPALAIVSDPTELKADAFFADAIFGDRVLIYPRIGRAFLYRPLTNQIVNIISFTPNTPESKVLASSTTATLKVSQTETKATSSTKGPK